MDDHQSRTGESYTAVGETKDWINELPDCILSYILSSLRIKDAAETSIVCRRWRNLWKTRPSDLVLDIANIFGSVYAPVVARHERYYTFASMTPRFERQCYIQRVNKVLEFLSCNKLDSFKVAFFLDREDTQALDKWVPFAITKLDLRLFRHYLRAGEDIYVFPHWIPADLNISTLKHLSLY